MNLQTISSKDVLKSWWRCLVILLFSAASAASAAGPTLTGVVKDHQGNALKDATVFIYTAGPKEGAGVLCPSCYPDCRKQATSDAQGRFSIEELDSALLFRVLVVAKGFGPEFVSKVDPAAKALEVTLKPVAAGGSPKQQLRGRVTDPEGEPVSGAVVNIRGVSRGEGTRFGGNDDVDPVAVTDVAGEFVINSTNAFDAAGVDVVARGFAKKIFQRLETGEVRHELQLSEGASIKGRLMRDGKPLPGVVVGVCGAERSSEIFVGDYSVATDDEGRFLFVNLPADTAYFLYGSMASLGARGAVKARQIRVGEDGSTFDAGDLVVEPAFEIAGQIRLTDGGKLPAKTRVMLSRKDAWDGHQVEADAEGRFRFAGVPAEPVGLHAQIKGYRPTVRNASLDPLNPYSLIGTVVTNKTDLVFEFEPGGRHDRLDGDQRALQNEPLRGAEAGKPVGEIAIAGTVVDAETGEPVGEFTVTPGRVAEYNSELIDWLRSRQTVHSNGQFEVFFTKQRQAPAVAVEAAGYAPQATPGLNGSTNLTFRLKKAEDIAGVILDPDGAPVNATTVFLIDQRNGIYVDGEKFEIRKDRFQQRAVETRSDAEGRFRFPPQLGAYGILVLDDAGYADVTVEELAKSPEVRLKKWGRVEGQLMIGSKPGAEEAIRLWPAHIPYQHHPRQFPPLSLYLRTKTDAEGRFVFDRVPPIHIEVYHEPKVRDASVGTIAMSQTTKFTLLPGETRQLALGGKGRPVIGRMEVNDYAGKINWRNDVFTLERIVPEPSELPKHENFLGDFARRFAETMSDEVKARLQEEVKARQAEFQKKYREFYLSEAGLKHHFAQARYALNFKPDGSFRVEDVPSGRYRLRVELREGNDPFVHSLPVIARLNREVEVPDLPGGRSDEPLDLGTLTMDSANPLRAGKLAPDFEVKSVDGETVRLSDFKGKYLLLDFWAVWCGPCVAETPHLKETFAAFKDDPRFAMLGLSLDPAATTPKNYAKKNELGWMQGFLGEWSRTQLPAKYGVEGIPAIFLIDPDGKVVATGLRGNGIKSAVANALGK